MPKPKNIFTCKACGNQELKWHGRCTKCWEWNTFEGKEVVKKKTPLGIKKKKPTGEKALFDEIWAERKHVSFVSGIKLEQYNNPTFYVNMFAHVLSKKNYPEFRLNKENIMLVTPEEHMLLDHGSKSQRERYAEDGRWICWEDWFSLKEELKEKYNKLYR